MCEGSYMRREKREMVGKESSNSTKLRYYGVCSYLRVARSFDVYECEMRIDAVGRTDE